MSFKDIVGDYVPKANQFTVAVSGKEYTFTAHELPYLDAVAVAVAQHKGLNPFAMQIARSIKDESGAHISYEQALALPQDIAQRFLDESGKANKKEAEKN